MVRPHITFLGSHVEREKARREAKTKRRLRMRQQKLLISYRRGIERFRRDQKIQIELRRVAKLCTKLDVPLSSILQDEIVRIVMDS